MTIKLYKVDGSPPCRGVFMTLELLGLQHEAIDIDVAGGETRTQKYFELNPEQTVPFLEDGDFKLGDSHAIIAYLVSKYGSKHIPTLFPEDLKTRATIYQRFFFHSSVVCKNLLDVYREFNGANKLETVDKVRVAIKDSYRVLEVYLTKTEFLAANHLTLADISLVATVSSLEPVVGYEGFPKLSAWLEKMKQYDWYKKGNQPGLEKMHQFFKTSLEKTSA